MQFGDRLRVLVLAKDFPSTSRPDAGFFVLRQVQALAALGHEALVVRVVPHAPPWAKKWRYYREIPDDDVVEGVAVRTIRALVAPRMVGFEYLPLQVDGRLRRLVDEFRPDIVHGHFLIPSGQLAVRYGLPSVITAHGSDAYDWALRRRGLRRAATEGLERATTVVAVSDFVRASVMALFDRDVHVVFNGADERVFAPRDRLEARRRLGLANDHFIISFAGLAVAAKGVFDLIEAAAQLHDLRPLLCIAGPQSTDDRLARCSAQRQVDVRTYGTLEDNELACVMAASDVFCLPTYRDGLPVSICEAMLSARPVVATSVGGIPEIVSDSRTGYLVPRGDQGTLAQRLRELAENPQLAQLLGQNGHAFAIRNLTSRINASAYAELFRQAVKAA
jgi:teichuronic acid biosynthesis glycosyltransferase TuaC